MVKWSQRFRATGSPAAKPMGCRRPRVLEDERDWLLGRVRAEPEVTVRTLTSELAGPESHEVKLGFSPTVLGLDECDTVRSNLRGGYP